MYLTDTLKNRGEIRFIQNPAYLVKSSGDPYLLILTAQVHSERDDTRGNTVLMDGPCTSTSPSTVYFAAVAPTFKFKRARSHSPVSIQCRPSVRSIGRAQILSLHVL